MIKETEVEIILASGLVRRLRDLGYQLPTHIYRGEERVTINVPFKIKVEHLSKKSHAKITRICTGCGEERLMRFEKYKPLCSKCSTFKISEALKGSKNGMFGRRGALHPNWNPEKTPDDRLLGRQRFQSKESQRWSRAVKEKFRFTCQKCAAKGGVLESHHVESWSSNKELRFEISNGICLCEKCHAYFHKLYGKRGNNRVQLNEFLEGK